MNPEPPAEPPLSEAGRITGVFFEPKKAFADIGARPRWLLRSTATRQAIRASHVFGLSTPASFEL